MSSRPEISVIIPVYNGEATLAACVESVLSQRRVAFEVIVVDDGSTDGTPGVLRRLEPRVVALRNPTNLGIAKTYNRGIRQARGSLLLLLASDCALVSQDYLRAARRVLEDTDGVGVVTGRPIMPDFPSMDWAARLFTALNRMEVLDPSRGSTEVNFTEARCDLARKDLIEEAGLFNEHLDRSNEDQDLSIQIRALGFRLIQDNSLEFVLQQGGTSDSLFKLLRKQAQYARGQAYIAVNYGMGNGGEGLWANRNRRRRALLRSTQVATVGGVGAAAVAALWWPPALLGVAAILATRSLAHGWFAVRRLRLSEALGALAIGPVCDLLYGSNFLFHCALWTLKGKSRLRS